MTSYQIQKGLLRHHLFKHVKRYMHNEQAKVLYPLKSRTLLKISGYEAPQFLQGLMTNDMNHFEDGALSMYTMFLNNKGRILYDSLIHRWDQNNVYMVECDKSVLHLLKKHLNVYKLKRKVEIGDMSPFYQLWALITPANIEIDAGIHIQRNINVYKDPRLPDLGYRLITDVNVDQFDIQEAVGKDTVIHNAETGYKYLRYKLGISEGADDLFPGSSLPLEANCDYLHGVSFHKGCYLGQELTARVYHTGVVRKRIMPIKFKTTSSIEDVAKDAPIFAGAERKASVGKLKSNTKDYGLGLVKIKEALEAKVLMVGQYPVEIIKPTWWPIEAPKEKIHIVKPEAVTKEKA